MIRKNDKTIIGRQRSSTWVGVKFDMKDNKNFLRSYWKSINHDSQFGLAKTTKTRTRKAGCRWKIGTSFLIVNWNRRKNGLNRRKRKENIPSRLSECYVFCKHYEENRWSVGYCFLSFASYSKSCLKVSHFQVNESWLWLQE